MTRARHEGIALASVLKLATKAYVDGDLTLGLLGSEAFNKKTARDITHAVQDISEGKHLSPGFTSAKDAIKFLKT